MDVLNKWGEEMSRLIRYDDAIERLGAHLMANAQIDWGGTASTDIEDWKELADMILNGVPTIDAVSVVHGEWIDEHEDGHGSWVGTCSQCHNTERVANFCPNCGARMKGKDNE
jgi:NADH pyrophosphatase NudC (nudix superfamily)